MEPIADWLNTLDHKSRVQILAAVSLLEEQGPDLKRPIVGKIKGSSLIPSMKELRPGSSGRSEIRILFVFDPKRKAIMLVGGDKQRKWDKWYRKAIPMSYTPERFMADSGITRDEVEAEKRRMLEEIRLYELKEARKAEHVTQKRLAQALGVSQKRISVIESGDVDHIKVDTLKRYLEGIGGTLHVTASLPGGKELRLV